MSEILIKQAHVVRKTMYVAVKRWRNEENKLVSEPQLALYSKEDCETYMKQKGMTEKGEFPESYIMVVPISSLLRPVADYERDVLKSDKIPSKVNALLTISYWVGALGKSLDCGIDSTEMDEAEAIGRIVLEACNYLANNKNVDPMAALFYVMGLDGSEAYRKEFANVMPENAKS